MDSRQYLKQAAAFHGHLGPWLALGLRAGRFARRVVSTNPFCLTAQVRCPNRTPYSCFLDGVQFGSGCTLGKGNIRVIRDSRRVLADFRRADESGPTVRLELRPELWTELHLTPLQTEAVVSRFARKVYGRRFDRLFIETRG